MSGILRHAPHSGTARRWLIRLVTTAAVVFVVWAWPAQAHAYPWMIRHEYTSCMTCHADPSGGGLLTAYGRAQGEILLRMQYGRSAEEDPGKTGNFLFGAVDLPESLLLGGSFRSALLRVMPAGSPGTNRFILMQSDATGQLTVGRFRANASVGYVHEGALGASLTRGDKDRLISRVHWVGVDLGTDNEVLLRAGRLNVPFGVRSVEHTMWVRRETRTDINAAQQYGIAASYNADKIRTELMGIVGNFEVAPDKFRSRGYAGYLEYALLPKLALGVSSMATNAKEDLTLLTPAWRHAHGIFARYSPQPWVVLTSEMDLLHVSQPTPGKTRVGVVGMLSSDFEPIQGLHLIPTFELLNGEFAAQSTSFGGWASAVWFFAPHADVRADAIWQFVATPAGTTKVTSLLGQVHFYL